MTTNPANAIKDTMWTFLMDKGQKANIKDFTAPYSFGVTLNITNNPIPIENVLRYIYEAKPAHLSVKVEVAFPKAKSVLYIGGAPGAITRMGVPEAADAPVFRGTLHAGGVFGSRQTLAASEDTAPSPAVTILRTGCVCSIISNP